MTKQNKSKYNFIPQDAIWSVLSNNDIFTLRKLMALTYMDNHACRMNSGGLEWLRATKESLFVHVFEPNSGLYGKPQLRLPGYKNKLVLKEIIQPDGPCDAYLVLEDPEDADNPHFPIAYAAYPGNLREQLDKGINKFPFLVAGAALSIFKVKEQKMTLDNGLNVSIVSRFGKSQRLEYDDVYEYYTNILEVEEISYGQTPMTRLTIELCGNLKIYLYVSKIVKGNYKFKVGDYISGEMTFYAVKEYANG